MSTRRLAMWCIAIGIAALTFSIIVDHDRAAWAALAGNVGTALLLLAVVDLLFLAEIDRREQVERDRRDREEQARRDHRARVERAELDRAERMKAQLAAMQRQWEEIEQGFKDLESGELARTLQEVRLFQVGLADAFQHTADHSELPFLGKAIEFAEEYASLHAEASWPMVPKSPEEYRSERDAQVKEIFESLVNELLDEAGVVGEERKQRLKDFS